MLASKNVFLSVFYDYKNLEAKAKKKKLTLFINLSFKKCNTELKSSKCFT